MSFPSYLRSQLLRLGTLVLLIHRVNLLLEILRCQSTKVARQIAIWKMPPSLEYPRSPLDFQSRG